MANEYERADHERDHRKHDWRPHDPLPLNPTDEQIAAKLGYIEREIREAATKGQIACAEAMQAIEKLMADLGGRGDLRKHERA